MIRKDKEIKKYEVIVPDIDFKAKLTNEIHNSMKAIDHPIHEIITKFK